MAGKHSDWFRVVKRFDRESELLYNPPTNKAAQTLQRLDGF
jgi:hypothetical protein